VKLLSWFGNFLCPSLYALAKYQAKAEENQKQYNEEMRQAEEQKAFPKQLEKMKA
jgi:hypothetical protein